MKKASTSISAIIAIVMLLAAFGVGFSVKQFRIHRAQKAAQAEPAREVKKPPVVSSAQPREDRRRPPGEFGTPQRGERPDERTRDSERFSNMSEDERRQAMRDRAERFGTRDGRGEMGGGRRPGGFGGMSDEERQAMRERFENMTEEERQEFRDQMRQRFGGRRRGGGPGDAAEGSFRPRGEREEVMEGGPDTPPEN